MSKRTHSEALSPGEHTEHERSWPNKRLLSGSNEPILFTRVRSLDELDKRTLQLQNKKLWEALSERKAIIAKLKDRIEQLENRQAKDDALLCVVNRYWNQLDEDGLILLQRFDSDMKEEISTSTESFLKQLASWDEEEVPEKLQQRVHFSKRIIARLLTTYEKLLAHQSRLRNLSASLSTHATDDMSTENDQSATSPQPCTPHDPDQSVQGHSPVSSQSSKPLPSLCDELSALNKENQRLQSLCTDLHAKHRHSSLKLKELQDRVQTQSDSAAEWQAKYEDIDYKLSQAVSQVTRLDHRLYEVQQMNKQLEVEISSYKITDGSDDASSSGTVNRNKYNDLACELEELRELLTNRTSELERVQTKLAEKVGENEALRMQLREVPEDRILESPQYLSLKSQFNLLFNEATRLKVQLQEMHSLLRTVRQSHLKQIQEMEINETAIQNQMRSEMLHMESQYSQLKRAHDTMELDFKQAMAHNEQAGPLNSEMRSLISTLQVQNKQLKAEVARYRRKLKEAMQDYELAKNELNTTEIELTEVRKALCELSAANPEVTQPETQTSTTVEPEVDVKPDLPETTSPASVESTASAPAQTHSSSGCPTEKKCVKPDTPVTDSQSDTPESPEEIIRDLRERLKRSEESRTEMSTLLNMYKVIPKDLRDKAALLQCEAKLQSELAEIRTELDTANSRIAELQQQNSRLVAQLHQSQQLLRACQQRIKAEHSSFPKASPSDRTPPVRVGAPTISPSTGSFKMFTIVSPEEINPATASTTAPSGRSSPPAPCPMPATVPELQLELQLTRRRLQSVEGQLDLCQHRLRAAQQQEDVLLKEMEVISQAFEDVQDQSARTVSVLREKDEGNLKLMAERMKLANSVHQLKQDHLLDKEQCRLAKVKIEALNLALTKQSEKEKVLLNSLEAKEKQLSGLQQALEIHKRKSIESQQSAEDLRVTVLKYQSQLKEAQVSVQEKASAFERISFGHQRLQEELVSIRRKYDRLKKIEQSHNADEVLLAEIQDYKEQLTCPTCKTNRKDAVLTKCFHVFCLHCLKTRYETRNRKCPKCNATFGANDYHRIYLS